MLRNYVSAIPKEIISINKECKQYPSFLLEILSTTVTERKEKGRLEQELEMDNLELEKKLD